MAAPTVTGQDTPAVVRPAALAASQRVGTFSARFSKTHAFDPLSGSKYVFPTIPWTAGRTPVTIDV